MTTATVQANTLSHMVAANVRAECARRGWTQQDLAGKLKMGRITVSDRHREKTPWTVDELEKLADLFGVEVGELLARPKGFEPLTFWLGAQGGDPDEFHTVVAAYHWQPGFFWGCDRCGERGILHNGPTQAMAGAESHDCR